LQEPKKEERRFYTTLNLICFRMLPKETIFKVIPVFWCENPAFFGHFLQFGHWYAKALFLNRFLMGVFQ